MCWGERGEVALRLTPGRGGAGHMGVQDPNVRMGEPRSGQPRASKPNQWPTWSGTQASNGQLNALALVPTSASSGHARSDVALRSVGTGGGGQDGHSTARPDSPQVSKPGGQRQRAGGSEPHRLRPVH